MDFLEDNPMNATFLASSKIASINRESSMLVKVIDNKHNFSPKEEK